MKMGRRLGDLDKLTVKLILRNMEYMGNTGFTLLVAFLDSKCYLRFN